MSSDQSTAAVAVLADYLDEQARRLHADLGAVAGVAVTLAVTSGPLTIGSSTELAADVDQRQYAAQIGPCLDSLATGRTHYVSDLAGDPRWQPYGRSAAERGARSGLSVPIVVEGQPVAVLKAYAAVVDGLTVDQRALIVRRAVDLAGGVALALALADTAQQLEDRIAAMEHRHHIDVAIGLLMGRLGCGTAEAFTVLRRQSQSTGAKLHEVARGLVTAADEGRLPTAPFRARGEAPVA